MNTRQLWLHAVREEQTLRYNASAWRMALRQLTDPSQREAVEPLVRALEQAQECAERTQKLLGQLVQREE